MIRISPSRYFTTPPVVIRATQILYIRFPAMRSLQKFAAIHGSVRNNLYKERRLSSSPLFMANRATTLGGWRQLCALWKIT